MEKLSHVLVIAHGHTHRIIQEISPESSLLLDIDHSVRPDIVADMGSQNLSKRIKQYIKHEANDREKIIISDVKHLINAFSPSGLVFTEVENEISDWFATTIDGPLNPVFIRNIWNLMAPNALFYTRPLFREAPREYIEEDDEEREKVGANTQLLSDKLFFYGFTLHSEKYTLTFDKTVMTDFIVYQKTSIPTTDEIIAYLQRRSQRSPKMKYVIAHVKEYYSEEDEKRDKYMYCTQNRIDLRLMGIEKFLNKIYPDMIKYRTVKELKIVLEDDTNIEIPIGN